MKFVIENLSKSSGRLGQLAQNETGKQFMTPLLLQTTKGGSIPYLSREVFEYVSKDVQILQMCLCSMNQMGESLKQFKDDLSTYVGFKNYPTMLVVRDPSEAMPSGSNDKDMVPLFTRRGKEPITAKSYMDLVEIFAPDMYQGLSDADTNVESSKKRVQKSVDRTEQFMDYCYERQRESEKLKHSTLFAPIVGGYNTFARSLSIKHAKSKTAGNNYGGYILEGFHSYGLSATKVITEKLVSVMAHCLKEMDVEKPKLMPGAYTPLVMLELIRLGVDMFDTSYAYCAAANFKVLTFQFKENEEQKNISETPFLDLTDEILKEDFSPFMSDCSCLACRKHTRAYAHHLYKTRELLGPILLMIHNLHHSLEFFETIRSCIAQDKLADLIKLVEYQNTDKQIDYSVYENTKVISKTGLGKGFITTN